MREYTGPNTLLSAFRIIRQAIKREFPSAGDGIEITDAADGLEIGVTTPVRGIMTQAEFGALPEAQQNNGLYVIFDGGSGGGGGSAWEVYSTEEARIGTWIDGKPLYRKVFVTRTKEAGITKWLIENLDLALGIDEVCDIRGVIKANSNGSYAFVSGNQYLSSDNYCCLWYDSGKIGSLVKYEGHANMPITIVFEYTKTTDEATVNAEGGGPT